MADQPQNSQPGAAPPAATAANRVAAFGSSATLAPFRNRFFFAVWLANLVSNFGGQIQSVGASWLMTTLTGSPQLVALVATASLIPILLFSLPFGAAADVFDRRKVLLTGQSLMLLASVILAALGFADLLNPWALLFFTFVLGCGFALQSPAMQATVGELVPPKDLGGAVSLNILGFNLARTAAPAVGGLIVAAGGPETAFTINALSYIFLLVLLITWRREHKQGAMPRETLTGAMGGGLRYIGNARGVIRIVGRASLLGVCLAALLALTPLVVTNLLEGTPELFGIMLGLSGAGAVAGALVATALRSRFSGERIVQAAQVIAVVAILIVAFSRTAWITGLGQLLSGLGMVLAMSTFNITMQMSVPRWIVGRAISVFQMGALGGLALGAWMWGAVAELVGIETALEASAVALVAALLVGFRFPLLKPDEELLRPGERNFATALPSEDVSSRAPVSVMVEFRISPEDRAQFLQLMLERRQIRRREGARRWSLSQDGIDPELWVERYLRTSLADFIRHRDRRTVEEERNIEKVSALHRGDAPPQIRFLIERDVDQASSHPGGPDVGY